MFAFFLALSRSNLCVLLWEESCSWGRILSLRANWTIALLNSQAAEAQMAKLYSSEFAQEDQKLAEEGLSEYVE